MTAGGVLAAIALFACVVAHVVLTLAILFPRRASSRGAAAEPLDPRRLWRTPLALALPPLAVWWGWHAGARIRVAIWLATVTAYAAIVTIAARGSP